MEIVFENEVVPEVLKINLLINHLGNFEVQISTINFQVLSE